MPDNLQTLTIRLPRHTIDHLREIANDECRSLNKQVQYMLERMLAETEEKNTIKRAMVERSETMTDETIRYPNGGFSDEEIEEALRNEEYFRQDNTEGFTDEELEQFNSEWRQQARQLGLMPGTREYKIIVKYFADKVANRS